MSRRIMAFGALLVMAVGAWVLWNKERIQSVDDAWKLAQEHVARWGALAPRSTAQRPADRVRIASFQLEGHDPATPWTADELGYLAEILTEFDLVALQNFPLERLEQIDAFIQRLNGDGGRYAIALPPRGESLPPLHSALVYNQNVLVLEGTRLISNQGVEAILPAAPWVGWFRCHQPEPEEAFTFSLVDVHLAAGEQPGRLAVLGDLFRAVRSDERGEDDVILAGNLQANESQLTQVRQQLGLTWLIRGVPTNVNLDRQTANLLLDPWAVSEYSGRSGALDFVKRFNLSLGAAQQISQQLPVWAEFSILEGAAPLQTASDPQGAPR